MADAKISQLPDGGTIQPSDQVPVNRAGTTVRATGAGGAFATSTVVLTDAQIKALPSTRVQVVPAPGAGKVVVPLYCLCVLDASAGVYTVDAGSSWQLLYGPSGGREASGIGLPNGAGTQLPNGAVHVVSVYLADFAGVNPADPNFGGYLMAGVKTVPTDLGLYIADYYNGVPDYTGGNPANTLTVMTAYAVLSLTP